MKNLKFRIELLKQFIIKNTLLSLASAAGIPGNKCLLHFYEIENPNLKLIKRND